LLRFALGLIDLYFRTVFFFLGLFCTFLVSSLVVFVAFLFVVELLLEDLFVLDLVLLLILVLALGMGITVALFFSFEIEFYWSNLVLFYNATSSSLTK
jgi:hypothetical protein